MPTRSLTHKMRLLTLADFGFCNIGQDRTQATAAQVERWVIAVSVPSARSFPYPFLSRIVCLNLLEMSGLR
jgi:hypothetical protein